MFRRAYFTIGVLIAYTLLMILIVWALIHLRGWTNQTYGSPQAQGEWQDFRDAVAESVEEDSPVRRDVPKSSEPPALVLLRDHFAACLAISLLLSSALFFSFALFLRGALTSEQNP